MGRDQKSSVIRHRGRWFGLRERLMSSPHPPGQLRQAHFLISPFSTTVSSSGAIIDRSGIFGARVVKKSKRRRCNRRKSRVIMCFMSAHHIQKWLHVSAAERRFLAATRAIRLRFNQGLTFVSGVKSPHAGWQHTGLSGKSGYTRQPLIDRHRSGLGRESYHGWRWIALAQDVGFLFQPLIAIGIIAS